MEETPPTPRFNIKNAFSQLLGAITDIAATLKTIAKTLSDLYIITRESALNHIVGETFIVNSGARQEEHEHGTDSDFLFKFPALFNPQASRIVVLQASIPKTFYLTEQNSITMTEGAISYTISLPRGNYNVISFRGTLAQYLTVASGNQGMGFVYSIDSPSRLKEVETGLMVLRVQGNEISPGIFMQPILTTDNSSIHEQLGLHPASSYTFVSNQLTSIHVCTFNLHSQVCIRSDICQNTQDNILQDIYAVSNVSNSYMVFENKAPNLYSKRLNNNGQTYHFWLTDLRGTIIDLHGIEMSFTVLVY